MRVLMSSSYEQMSEHCAKLMLDTVRTKPDARIVLATGYSTLRAYRLFVERIVGENTDVSRVIWIKLDEWLGIPKEHPATCEHFLWSELLSPLNIASSNYIGFEPLCSDPERECDNISQAIRSSGGIDLMILGIGRNGHLGLNEPGSALNCAAHIAELDAVTMRHEMLARTGIQVAKGLTLGMADIFSARRVILLAAGGEKQGPLAEALSGRISTHAPVSLLQLHQDAICLTDHEM